MTLENKGGSNTVTCEHDSRNNMLSKVEAKYRGTAADQRDMKALGKTQELRRNFKFVTMLGFASTVMASWEVLLVLFKLILTDGGTPNLFWGFLVDACGMLFVYASLAELASMSPTAGGQYHWVSELTTSGWFSAIGWQVYLAGVCFMVGGLIQALISLNHEAYVAERWHQTLLTIAVVVSSVVFNTVLAVKLPLIEGILLVLHLCGVLVVVIPLWVMAPRAPVDVALFQYTNVGGWDTTALAALIGMVTPLNVLIGYDCTVHMAEELHDASITLPRAIMWSVAPNACLGILVISTLAFCSGDIEEVLQTRTGEPFVQIFYNATGSKAASSVMVTIVIILLISCCFSEVATASRQLWSFARDKGLPASTWLEKVRPGWNIPLRAVFVSVLVVLLLSLINIGSTTALRSISSLGAVAILGSYLVTIGTLIWRRLFGAPLPPRRWSLGKWGLGINITAFCFVLPLFVFAFFPLTREVDRETFNYASVMFVGVLLIALVIM
ncbi:amino acid transporter-like protein [Hortaea werneckii]|nr:amino acid transporter-like protein [Hortaea werneckii]KAI7722710.1 amino acid transporter-like protein [Hortaea werneckii]